MQRREFNYVSDDHIATAADKARVYVGRLAGPRDFHRAQLDKLVRAGLIVGDTADALQGGPDDHIRPVDAFVNHGRWVAKCECGGAEVVDPDDPFFLCLSCLNAMFDGKLRRAVFPAGHRAIEQALRERKDSRTRNWGLGETAEDIRRQTQRERERGKE